jgi:hypothetical protein
VESFVQNIAAGFGLKCKSITREKFGHICATTCHGPVMIQKVQAHIRCPENLLFQHEVKEYLYANDFGPIDRFFLSVGGSGESSAEGLPYHKVGEDFFTATMAFNAPKADFTQEEDFLAIISRLALMHKILGGALGAAETSGTAEASGVTGSKISSMPKKRNEQIVPSKALEILSGYKKRIIKSGKFSEFDMLFLNGYEKFAPYISNCKLGHNNYICHNLLKEENIYIAKHPIFTNFSAAEPAHYLYDLAYIIKRYLKTDPHGKVPLGAVLETYNSQHSLTDFDLDFFKAMLLYPDKFINLARSYYSKKRSFAPKTYLTRIDECFLRIQSLEKYLEPEI